MLGCSVRWQHPVVLWQINEWHDLALPKSGESSVEIRLLEFAVWGWVSGMEFLARRLWWAGSEARR